MKHSRSISMLHSNSTKKILGSPLQNSTINICKKVVAVGDAGCGKTTLLIALSTDRVLGENIPHTLEYDNIEVEIDGKSVQISLCGIAG